MAEFKFVFIGNYVYFATISIALHIREISAIIWFRIFCIKVYELVILLVLCGYEICCFTVRGEHILEVFNEHVIRKRFECKREEGKRDKK